MTKTESDVLVLCYHAISESWSSDLAVSPDLLEAQIRLLLGRGYRGATFYEAVTAPPAARTLAVTFVDGYRSVHDHAFGGSRALVERCQPAHPNLRGYATVD